MIVSMAGRPWLRSYPEGIPPSLEPYPEAGLFSLLEGSAGGFPRNTALAFFGKHITYAELLAEAERCSAMLAALGVRQGDRGGFVLPNCPQYVIACYAAVRLGAIVVGNNPLYTKDELAHQLKDAGARVLVVLDQLYENVAAVCEEAGVREVVVTKLTDYMPFPLNLLAPIRFRRDAIVPTSRLNEPTPPDNRGFAALSTPTSRA